MKAAIYARTSSPNQRYNFSIDAQIDQCLKHCAQRDWKVTYVFIDECQSAKNTDRVRFKQMMEKAGEKRFDVVVFWKLDRLCRSLVDTVNTEKILSGHDVSLCSVTEYIDTTTSVGRFNFRNLASVAEFEREIIGERARMGLHELAKQHRWPNPHPPYGYRIKGKGILYVSKAKAKTIRRIFKRYLETESMQQVAYELNHRRLKTGRGEEWSAPGVRIILSNRLYVGEYSVAGHTEQLPEARIIDDYIFNQAQSIRLRFKNAPTSKPRMQVNRRREKLTGILDQYRIFLNERTHAAAMKEVIS